VYRSPSEIPERLRRRLEKSMSGIHSATILIADRRGREEIVRALRGMPSAIQSRLASSQAGRRLAGENSRFRLTGSRWLQLLGPAAVALAAWLFYELR
jgi:hypothetical protein